MNDQVVIEVLAEDSEFIPKYETKNAAGCDVKAFIDQDIVLLPGKTALIPTGLRVSIPDGYEIQVRPRSGLALKFSITVLNTPGTIDADYRGEIGIILINHGLEPFVISRGMRIAQLIVNQVHQANFLCKSELTTTARGEGGFGHSGTH